VNGEVRAFRKADGSQLWSNSLQNAWLIRRPAEHLPVLLCIQVDANVKPAAKRLRVIDKRSGSSVGEAMLPAEVHLMTDLTFDPDPKKQQIDLVAWNQNVVVKLVNEEGSKK
jgi:hypothetical protein